MGNDLYLGPPDLGGQNKLVPFCFSSAVDFRRGTLPQKRGKRALLRNPVIYTYNINTTGVSFIRESSGSFPHSLIPCI